MTVALYCPLVRPVMLAVKVIFEVAPEASLPLAGLTVSQGAEGVPAVHLRPLPPVLVTTTVCAAGLLPPAVAVKLTVVVLSCKAGGAMLMMIGIVIGLFATGLPVAGSVAVTTTLVV